MTSDPGFSPLNSRLWTFTDQQFYDLELQVFEKLKNEGNDRCVTAACKDLGLDPYDFKDRWGPLLRSHKPSEVLENILKVKPLVGKPIHDIAVNLGMSVASVRTLVRKLSQTPTSRHVRTKENLAHRYLSTTGCSLTDAKKKVSSICKGNRAKNVKIEEESMSEGTNSDSDCSEYSQVSEKRSESETRSRGETVKKPCVSPEIPSKAPSSWYSHSLKLIECVEFCPPIDPKSHLLPADTQLKLLSELSSRPNPDISQIFRQFPENEAPFRANWQSILKLIPSKLLDSSIFAILSLSRLGYGMCKIADMLNFTPNYVNLILTNLGFELGLSDNRSFDYTLSIINHENLQEAAGVERCKSDLVRSIPRRVKNTVQVTEQVRDSDLAERVVWLYERGLSVDLISSVLGVPRALLRSLPED